MPPTDNENLPVDDNMTDEAIDGDDLVEAEDVDEDFVDEEEEEIDPNSDLLAPVQLRIKEQLLRQAEEKFLIIKEKRETLKRIAKEREDVGVQLYSTQQVLAKLQEEVEKYTENIGTMKRMREDVENQRTHEYEVLQKKRQDRESLEKRLAKTRKDRDALMEQIIQVERHNETIAQEVVAKRRATHKTEEAITDVEKEKKEQDYLLDHLYEKKTSMENDIAMLKARIDEQKAESQVAKQMLKEANVEIEAAHYETKILQQQWKSSLIGTQRRNEALSVIEDGLRKQVERMQEIENEIEGYKSSINAEKEKHEQLTSSLIRLENEKHYLDKQIEELYETQEQMQDQYNSFQRTLDNTEAEIHNETQKKNIIQKQIETLDKRSVQTNDESKALDDLVISIYSDQTTFKRVAQSSLQTIQRLNDAIREKENAVAQVDNETARIHIDKLQKREHNKVLEEMLREIEEELQSTEKMVEKYQQEIRRRHDDIEKKQSTLDLLNKALEKHRSGSEDENLGPLEATIKNLSNSMARKDKESETTKKNWLRHQTELVNLMEENERMTEELRDTKTRQTILMQKKIRLENLTRMESSEITELNASKARMHIDFVKLNSILSKNSSAQKELANTNFDLENQIIDNLKKKEREASNLEGSVRDTKEEKKRLLDELVEVERQIMYWEKKIEVQKEIQETLDPEIGQDEVRKMKKEVHIMEQRLLELKRNHKRMVHEMEKSVSKRDIILTKDKAAAGNSKKVGATVSSLRGDITHLERQLAKKKAESRKAFDSIKELQKQAEETGEELVTLRDRINEKHEESERLRKETCILTLTKSRVLGDKKRIADMYQFLNNLKSDKYVPKIKEKDLDHQRQVQVEKAARVKEIITEMRNLFPHYDDLLSSVSGMLE